MSLLKGIAAFGIVGCHLNLHPLTEGAAFALGFCDLNVALFALISGWLMHVENWKDYVAKRMKRLVPIYAVWSVMYVILGLLFDVFVAKEMSPYLSNPWHWVNVVFRGESASQLWYLICLFYAQVLFACVCNRLSRTWWLVVGCGIVVLATVNNEFFLPISTSIAGVLDFRICVAHMFALWP